nr:hypothetical protein [uncultured Carboxylicivirga sp.]
MKVNFKNIFVAMALVAGLGFTSCSKDEVTPDDPEKIKPLPPTVEHPIAPEIDKEPQI